MTYFTEEEKQSEKAIAQIYTFEIDSIFIISSVACTVAIQYHHDIQLVILVFDISIEIL